MGYSIFTTSYAGLTPDASALGMVKIATNIKTPSLGSFVALHLETDAGPSGPPSGGIFVSQFLGL